MSHNKFNIQQLPLEVLQQIFIFSCNPAFASVSRLFHYIANSQTSVKTQWLLHKFNHDCPKALYRGLKWRFFNKNILSQLDLIYYQSKVKIGETSDGVIPYKDRPIPLWFFSVSDPNDIYYELVKILLNRGASPNEPDGYPIIKSAQLGRLKMAKLLISFGAKADTKDNMALIVASKSNDFEMVKLLLDSDVKADSNALKVAVEKKHWKMAEFLMSKGAIPTQEVVEAFEKNK
ncbi:hypothetical protein C1645_747729 [Glomus cerebriforme]|uniref:Uncharacterized protein n=1 Tax=Glomus cerebriforme TaxID=658196 RepID=A0A397TRJ7_9GLOM|nr:hypothetical protein C1645_747729 [Glomus cerebriforme]